MTGFKPTPEMIEAFRQEFYFNTADEGADPIELGLIAAFKIAFGDEEAPRYTTRRMRQEIDRVREQFEAKLEEARAVIAPFAAFFQYAEGFVQARAEQGGPPILSTNTFKLADFHAAARFMECKTVRPSTDQPSPPPVDRSAVRLASGGPVTEDHRTIDPATGQQKGYVVLGADERAKGFVRPYRDAYRHLRCKKITTMGRATAETYARDPAFYGGTFCSTCKSHFPVGEDGEFTWYEMDGSEGPKVGT